MAIEILSSLKTSSDIKGKGSLNVDGSIKSGGNITDGYDKNVKVNADNIATNADDIADLRLNKVNKKTTVNGNALEQNIVINSEQIPLVASDANNTVKKKFDSIDTSISDLNNENARQDATIASLALGNVPLGGILPYAGDTSLIGKEYFPCDGRNLKKSEYKDLYEIIGDVYKNNTTASDEFGIPNLNGTGRYLRAPGTSNSLGATQEDALPNILATIGQDDQQRAASAGAFSPIINWYGQSIPDYAEGSWHTTGGSLFSANSFNAAYGRDDAIKIPSSKSQFDTAVRTGSTTEVRPKSLTVNWIIRVRQSVAEDDPVAARYINETRYMIPATTSTRNLTIYEEIPDFIYEQWPAGGTYKLDRYTETRKNRSITISRQFKKGLSYYINIEHLYTWAANHVTFSTKLISINGKSINKHLSSIGYDCEIYDNCIGAFGKYNTPYKYVPDSDYSSLTIVFYTDHIFTNMSYGGGSITPLLGYKINVQSGTII